MSTLKKNEAVIEERNLEILAAIKMDELIGGVTICTAIHVVTS